MSENKRINILTHEELQEIYGHPRFSEEDRLYFFKLNGEEEKHLKKFRSLESKVFFILNLGYFKAKQQIFPIKESEEVNGDIHAILKMRFPSRKKSELKKLPLPTEYSIKNQVLQIQLYKNMSNGSRKDLLKLLREKVKISLDPVFLFREIISFVGKRKIVLPSYSTLQDTIGKILSDEEERIQKILMKHLPSNISLKLSNILKSENKFNELSNLKRDSKNFSYGQMKKEIEKKELIANIFKFATKFIPKTKISTENVKYYGSRVEYYTTHRLQSISESSAKFHLICYIYDRFKLINDNLINCLTYHVKKINDEVIEASREQIVDHKVTLNQTILNTCKVLNLFVDENIPDDLSFGRVRKMAYKIIEKDKIENIQAVIKNSSIDLEALKWENIEQVAPKFKKNIRQVIMNIELDGSSANESLIQAIQTIQRSIKDKQPLKNYKNFLPSAILSEGLKKHIVSQSEKGREVINLDRYEFLVYSLVSDGFESGDIFCKNSNNYRSISDDLIDEKEWKKIKKNISKNLDIDFLTKESDQFLDELQELLENKYAETNDNIVNKSNAYIKLKKHKGKDKWVLPYKKLEESFNPVFDKMPQTSVYDIMCHVNEKTKFISDFKHISMKNCKTKVDPQPIFASLIALGTNIGLSKMTSISNISWPAMRAANSNFIRPETLKSANDSIINYTVQLPSYELYKNEDGCTHSSSDGQKYETHFNTTKSRNSPKYFGLKKGVVCYSLIANHIPINAKVIGANEHESHHVFDILYNNTSEIKPDIHSTDSHGVNNVNFFILDCFGYKFAPRYKNIGGKFNRLVSFKSIDCYRKKLISPSMKIDIDLIKSEWENIKRIIASLAMKKSSQSIIIKKLSSHQKQNNTHKALQELDNIFETIYILDYINDVTLRQKVQKSLNRGEAYHKLRKGISIEKAAYTKARSDKELNIWNECSRLLANSIICFNNMVLSQLLLNSNSSKKNFNTSPVAWSYVNFYGKFLFGKPQTINMTKILNSLNSTPYSQVG